MLLSKNNNPEYIPALDGLRAIACLLVILFHSPLPNLKLEIGWIGVNIFFILSGFLITRILVASKHLPLSIYLKFFYQKRIKRIFPLYFFYLSIIFLTLLAGDKLFGIEDPLLIQAFDEVKRNYGYLITFTYNLSPLINHLLGHDYRSSILTGHLWTVSVEMQFYFLFPLIVYYIPIKALKKLLLIVILLVPILRLVMVLSLKTLTKDLFWIGYLLYESSIFQLDSLSLGACLALFNFNITAERIRRHLVICSAIALAIGLFHYFFINYYGLPYPISSLGFDIPVNHQLITTPSVVINNRYFYSIPLINFVVFLIVYRIVRVNIRFRTLESVAFVKLGRLSYEIYLFHLAGAYFIAKILI